MRKQKQSSGLTFIAGFLLFFCGIPALVFAKAHPKTSKEKDKLSVYIFLAETCPISQFYTLTLKDLYREFGESNLKFKGVFPNAESTEESVAEFKKTYDLPFEMVVDTD